LRRTDRKTGSTVAKPALCHRGWAAVLSMPGMRTASDVVSHADWPRMTATGGAGVSSNGMAQPKITTTEVTLTLNLPKGNPANFDAPGPAPRYINDGVQCPLVRRTSSPLKERKIGCTRDMGYCRPGWRYRVTASTEALGLLRTGRTLRVSNTELTQLIRR
jgi:hypothetical protein